MKVVCIASGEGWHVRDLRRAGAKSGIEIETVSFRSIVALVSRPPRPGGELRAAGLDLELADLVLVRSMPAGSLEQIIYRMDALHRLQAAGVRVLNSPRALEAAIDKYLSLSRLAGAGLPVPPTAACEHAESAIQAFDELGGDVVVKPLFGSEGTRMMRLRDRNEALACFRFLEESGAVIYQQRFIDHPGWDLRVLLARDEAVGCMRRRATGGWLTNIARGGRPEPFELTPPLLAAARAAASAIGADIAGIDLVPDRDGRFWVLEVNAVPGWRGLQAVTGRDIAAAILERVIPGELRP